MIINALNSRASTFMADVEDACVPSWRNLIEGQLNLCDAVAGSIAFTDPSSGKAYALVARPAVLIVRPRGWHLDEEHLLVDGCAMSASLFDFGLYFFTMRRTARQRFGRVLLSPQTLPVYRRLP